VRKMSEKGITLEELLEKHCKHISFEEGFETAKSLEDMLMVYKAYLFIIIDRQDKIMESTIDIGLMSKAPNLALEEIRRLSQLFRLRLYKLESTFGKYLKILGQNGVLDMNEYLKKDNDLKMLANHLAPYLKEIMNEYKAHEQHPELETINEFTKGNDPVLRKWTNGKYKCASLPKFITAYCKKADNLTPALIRDYLISERTGRPYSDDTIEKDIFLYGPDRK